MGCNDGWKMPLCKMPCTDNTYGTNCSMICGNCANDDQCNHITGVCPNGCMSRFSGENCDVDRILMMLIERAFIIAGSVALGIYVIVMIFCTIFCVRSRKKRNKEMHLDDDAEYTGDENHVPVRMRHDTGRDGVFLTHLNSLMTFGQTPRGSRRQLNEEPTFRPIAQGSNIYATSGWRDSEFSEVNESNYANVKSVVGPPRTTGGLIYANGILIDQNATSSRASCGDVLNDYVNMKNIASPPKDDPPAYSERDTNIYQNSVISHL